MNELAAVGLVTELVRERHEARGREAAREQAAAAVAGPSLGARVARALTRRGHEAASPAAGPAPMTMPARSLSGAGH